MSYTKEDVRFQRVNLIAIIALFIVILAGGVVRSTGSGMGCPDWPRCFGRYIPPVKEEQLPKNYRTVYIEKQLKKNLQFAKLLNTLGYTSLAYKVKFNTKLSSKQQEEFNPAKTWTEYLNRLIGVITGILLLLTTFYSINYWKRNKVIVVLSFFNLILIAFQAWIGSIVVSSNLVPWIVTVHMLLALAILAISIYTWHKAKLQSLLKKVVLKPVIIIISVIALILDTFQIIIGTEVREKIDEYASKFNGENREDWVNGAQSIILNHKNMALAVIIINVIIYLMMRKSFERSSIQRQLVSVGFIIIMLQILFGILLSYWSLPPFAQAAHILLASLLFSTQFYLLLNLFNSSGKLGVGYDLE